MKRAFQIEFKRGVYSAGFYIGILLITAAGVIGAGTVMEYITAAALPEGEIRFVTATYIAVSSETLGFILPVACTLAMGASYLEDLQNGVLYYIMIRSTKKRYRLSKVMNCALFGGFVTLISVVILLIIFLVKFPPDSLEMTYLKAPDMNYFLVFLQKVLLLLLNGSFYSLLGGTIAAFTNNKYMAYAAPLIFYYVISTLLDAYLADIYLINPKEWMLVRYSKIAVVLGILVVVNVVVTICYSKIIERRWKND